MMGMRRPSEMLESVHQTSALAVHATPELQQAFAEWLRELEDRAVGLLAKGKADGAQLARSLKIAEASALYLLHRLATSGKVNLVLELKNQPRS
jgi:hypothetical protein